MNLKKIIKIPVLLSAFVCPGAGQFMQKRWEAGAVYLLLFLSMFGYLMTIALKNIVSFYRLGFEFDSYEPEQPISTSKLFLAFGIALLIYLANIVDAAVAHHRIHSRKKREDFLHQDNLDSPG